MDNKTLISNIAKRTGATTAATTAALDALAAAVKESCCQLDTVAVPGFGNFVPVKEDEKIVPDLSTGQRMLLPPSITLTFEPSAKLRKAANSSLNNSK